MPNQEFTYHFALIRSYRRGFRGLAQYPFPAFAGRHDGLDHGVGHPPAASGPRHSTAAPEARHGRGRRCDAERTHMAETVRKAHERFPQFSWEGCAAIVHTPGLFHIGGAAYFVWAYPP